MTSLHCDVFSVDIQDVQLLKACFLCKGGFRLEFLLKYLELSTRFGKKLAACTHRYGTWVDVRSQTQGRGSQQKISL